MNKQVNIRPYRPADQAAVRQICIATSSIPVKTERQRRYLLTMYNDYYTQQSPTTCWVAVDTEDTPIGYILCAPDYDTYWQIFRSTYVPRLRKGSLLQASAAYCEARYQRKYAAMGFPAHLHIDIRNGYQHMGIGTQLMDALTNRLRQLQVSGVFLVAGSDNEKAIRFYQKYGFIKIGKPGGAVAMGLRL